MRRLAAAYVVFAVVATEADVPSLCPWRRLTGRRCPACGLTTAVAAALRGELRVATRAHPLAVPVAVAAVTLAAVRGGRS